VVERIEWLWLHLRVLQLSRTAAVPVVACSKRWRSRTRWWVLGMSTPLRAWRATYGAGRLIGLRVYVLWQRRTCLVGQSVGRLAFQQSQTCLDVNVVRVQFGSSGISVQSITRLIITRLVL